MMNSRNEKNTRAIIVHHGSEKKAGSYWRSIGRKIQNLTTDPELTS